MGEGRQALPRDMKRGEDLRKLTLLPFLSLLGVLLLGALFLFRSSHFQRPQHTISVGGDYFLPIPIINFTRPGIPCLAVTIESKTIAAELDLGLRGDLSFSSSFISKVQDKKYLRSKTMYGIRGVGYEKKLYELPQVSLGNAIFSHPTMYEDIETMQQGSSFLKKQGNHPSRQVGRVGWELFRKKNLFLDLDNSLIALCGSISALKEQGYPVNTFTKTPLFTERGLIEFYAEAPTGPIRCMIDTGTSRNILNTELKEGQELEQAVWDPDSVSEYDSFHIGKKNFGSVSFLHIPIHIPIHIEAILGVEFLLTHLVFLDFSENYIYFGSKKI